MTFSRSFFVFSITYEIKSSKYRLLQKEYLRWLFRNTWRKKNRRDFDKAQIIIFVFFVVSMSSPLRSIHELHLVVDAPEQTVWNSIFSNLSDHDIGKQNVLNVIAKKFRIKSIATCNAYPSEDKFSWQFFVILHYGTSMTIFLTKQPLLFQSWPSTVTVLKNVFSSATSPPGIT